MTCLRAMQHATYSLFIVESVERGFGVTVRDLRSNETYLSLTWASAVPPSLDCSSLLDCCRTMGSL